MSAYPILKIVNDPTANGGARALGTLLVPSITSCLFQYFDLSSSTSYWATIVTPEQTFLCNPVQLTLYDGGKTGEALLDTINETARGWMEDAITNRVKIGVFTQEGGWCFFADVIVTPVAQLPSIES